jgi:hypothetical protein
LKEYANKDGCKYRDENNRPDDGDHTNEAKEDIFV